MSQSCNEYAMSDYCYKIFNACFLHPFNMTIGGPTQAGKSTFIFNLLKNKSRLIDKDVHYIVLFHGQETNLHRELATLFKDQIVIVEGLPESFDSYIKPNLNGLFVFDDMFDVAYDSKMLTNMICKQSHHESISTIVVTHNVFADGKQRKNMWRNNHYLVLMKNKLDMSVPHTLASRLMPKNRKTFINIFEKATSRSYGYLVIDGHPLSIPEVKYRTNIFEDHQIIFIPTVKV